MSLVVFPSTVLFDAESEWEDATYGPPPTTRTQPGRAARTKVRYPTHDGSAFLDLSSVSDESPSGSGSEWVADEGSEQESVPCSPTSGRPLTVPERILQYGIVARGEAYCLPCLAEAEAYNITDVDGAVLTGQLYK